MLFRSEFRDLFREKTYEKLVSEAAQDTVVWGDWEFKRPGGTEDPSQFLIQRSLGENTRLHFREYKPEERLDYFETSQAEVGLEYRLRPKEFLKLQLREDEKFVGVERKMRF